MANDGVITQKDIIEDKALTIGKQYADNMQLAINANKEMVSSLKEINKIASDFKAAKNQEDYLTAKQNQTLATQKLIDGIKAQEAAEISLQKIEKASLDTQKKKLELEAKQATVKKTNTKLTIEERVQNEVNNRILKEEARERLGLVGAYTKLNKARTDAKKVLLDLLAAEQKDIAAIKEATKAFDVLDKRVRAADQAVGDFHKSVGNYPKLNGFTNGIKNLVGAFGLVGGITAFASVVTSAFNLTKELQSLDLALKSVTGSQEEFNIQQSFLKGLAEESGQEINSLTKQFTAFYVAAKGKLAGNEIQQIFSDISKSGSALGLSNEALERSFTAVNQMLSKGTVSSEELRGQLAESLPGAVQAMTKAVQKLHPEIKNLTEKGLFDMIKAGKILAADVLPETSKQLAIITNAENASKVDTLAKSTNRLSNQWVELVRSLNEADTSGFSMFIKEITNGLGNILTFTSLLFKDENQLQKYFKDLGKAEGLKEYQAIMKNISTVSKEQQEITKQALLERERETIRVNEAIIRSEKKKRESIIGGNRALFHLQTKAEEDALVQLGKSAAIIKSIKQSELPTTVKKTGDTTEPTEKEIKDALKRAKELNDAIYELERQRLERLIKINDEIASDEKLKDEVRIKAVENVNKNEIALAELTKKHKLDADKFVLAEDRMNANQRLFIQREAANKIADVEKKAQKDIDKIREFDEASYQKSLDKRVSRINENMNKELELENTRFKELGDLESMHQEDREKTIEAHEKRVFQIKKKAALASLRAQADTLQDELDASDMLPDKERLTAEKRQEIVEKLSKAKSDIAEKELEDYDKKNKEKVNKELQLAEDIRAIATDLSNALGDLANALFDAKIQNIDEEIDKNNEFYEKQTELAGDDEAQKELLEIERAKKEEELQKKKRKEQEKQAKFNKALAIAQAALNLGVAVTAALTVAPPASFAFAALTAAIAGIQLAAVIATPIPKYKMGRKGGKKEMAIVGDGGVSEVIERKSGEIEITPNKDTLVQLMQGDSVYKSVDDYTSKQRKRVGKDVELEAKKLNEFQKLVIVKDKKDPELINEIKKLRKSVERNKPLKSDQNNVDLSHAIWKLKNQL